MNHARRDLCGGCAEMRIPTAINHQWGVLESQRLKLAFISGIRITSVAYERAGILSL